MDSANGCQGGAQECAESTQGDAQGGAQGGTQKVKLKTACANILEANPLNEKKSAAFSTDSLTWGEKTHTYCTRSTEIERPLGSSKLNAPLRKKNRIAPRRHPGTPGWRPSRYPRRHPGRHPREAPRHPQWHPRRYPSRHQGAQEAPRYPGFLG